MVLLVGGGANGKSAYLNLLTHLLGAGNVSHLSLQDLGANRFAPVELHGRLANICADIPGRQVDNVATFKAIVGGDSIMAERKYSEPFTFTPYARLLFSANEIPGSPDTSYAYTRRWQVIPFNNKFEGDAADRNLIQKITTPEEISGLLRFALLAYADVVERGAFSTGESTQQAMMEFKEAIDPVMTFVREKTFEAEWEEIDRTSIYAAYKEWCLSSGHKSLSARKFYPRALQHVPEVAATRRHGRDVWTGIGILPG